MKKLIAIFLIAIVTYSTFAQDVGVELEKGTEDYRKQYRKTLIDFTQIDQEQDQTLFIEYSNMLKITLPKAEADNLPKIDYALQNWKVIPQRSIRYPHILDAGYTKGVEVLEGDLAGQTVFGIKIKFPDFNFDMYVDVQPPFPPVSTPSVDNPFVNNGLLLNVGMVRSAYMTVYGLYQDEKLYLVTEDDLGNEYEYSFGSLNFVGWKTMEWVNPNYLENTLVREIKQAPFYPRMSSSRRIKTIKVQRSAVNGTLDFVTYIKNIEFVYDNAVNENLFNEFAHEETWKILENSSMLREKILLEKTSIERYFEYLNNRKKYDFPTDSIGGQ